MSVSLNQSKGVEGWNYTFEVSPASLSFDAAGGTKQVSVTSYRRQTVNGIENGVQENVGYSSSVSGEGFSSNGTVVTAEENMNTSTRNGGIIFIQDDSSKIVSITMNQLAAIINNITVTGIRYSGTTVYKAEAQYPVSTDVEIQFEATYSPGGGNDRHTVKILIKKDTTSETNATTSGYDLFNGECTPSYYGNQLFNVILGDIVAP